MSALRNKIIQLDGKTLEGGGQLLRLALSLSCLTGRAIEVTDIRGNRTRRKGNQIVQGGGMKGSHYECAKWLARAGNATTKGMAVGSSSLLFQPHLEETNGIDAVLDDGFSDDDESSTPPSGWSDVSKSEVKPRYLTIRQKTPGAVYLIVQALLPYVLFGPFCLPREGESEVPKVHLRVIGGTNVSHSPSHEYATQVLFPTLAEHLGVPAIRTTLVRRGWSNPGWNGGPGKGSSLGEVRFEITPVATGVPLQPFSFVRDPARHRLIGLDLTVLASPPEMIQSLRSELRSELRAQLSCVPNAGLPIETVIEEDSRRRNRIYVLVVAKVAEVSPDGTPCGPVYRLAVDTLHDGRAKQSPDKNLPGMIARSMARDLVKLIVGHGGGSATQGLGLVDDYMLDQLVVFQALAAGYCEVASPDKHPSEHALTARWVAEQILDGLTFDGGKCDGIGFIPGAQIKNPSAADAVADFEGLSLEEKG